MKGLNFGTAGPSGFMALRRKRQCAVGRTSHALLQTKFPVEFIELITRLRNERHWSGELRHICKDGHEVIVESRQQLLSDSTVIEVNRDVTERKQIEADLREAQQHLF